MHGGTNLNSGRLQSMHCFRNRQNLDPKRLVSFDLISVSSVLEEHVVTPLIKKVPSLLWKPTVFYLCKISCHLRPRSEARVCTDYVLAGRDTVETIGEF